MMRSLSVSDCRGDPGQHEYRNLLSHIVRQEAIFLEDFYPVILKGTQVGKVSVQQQGLYYRFACKFGLEYEGIYRLQVSCSGHCENLGVLIPVNGCFSIETRIPVKRIGRGELMFQLIPAERNTHEIFIPISPEEPFGYISRLKTSFLQISDGKPGILIKEPQE